MNKTVTLNGEYTVEELQEKIEQMKVITCPEDIKDRTPVWIINESGYLIGSKWMGYNSQLNAFTLGNLWLVKPSEEEVDMWNLRQESRDYIKLENYVVIGQEYKRLTVPKRFQEAWEYDYTNIKHQGE